MYKSASLDKFELKQYYDSVGQSHLIRYIVKVLDENDDELGSLTLPHNSRLLSGQRDIDVTQKPTRTLTLDAIDRFGEIALHPNHPSEHGIYVNRMLQVLRGVFVPRLQKWHDTPIFTGPITKFTRDQEQVHLEAGGKELLFMAPHLMWTVKSFKKGADISDIMKIIMQAKGERKFEDWPEIHKPLPKHLSIGRHQEGWPVLERLARTLNRHLFYDGRGVPKLRMFPDNPQWTFHDGELGTIITRPSFSFDLMSIRNLVEVLGPKPSGKKQKRIRSVARLPASHLLSPESLAWNGELRFLVESIDIDAPDPADKSDSADKKAKRHETLVHRQKYADDLSKRRLRELSREDLTVTVDVAPFSDLEELDVVGLQWEGDFFEARLKQSTLPFHSENMTIGYLKRVPPHRRFKRKRNRGQ